jgi:bacillithiol biosynthesis cysteine-adding enzyme BshC
VQQYQPLVQPPSASPSDSALGLAVDVRTLPWMRPLAIDYAFEFEKLAPFFGGNPSTPSAWADAIRRAQRHARPRPAIVEMLAAQQARRGSPPEARAAVAALANPGTVAVVTGQQAGLFGGPLFTLLKALTAVRLAQRVTRDHGVPAVAVFWIDAEDHDWDEIAACGVLGADHAVRHVAVDAPEGAGERPVASLAYDTAISRAIDELSATVPPTEFTRGLVDSLRDAYLPGRGVADAFGAWLDQVLGVHGLVVYDASDPAAKPFAAPIFRRELEQVGLTTGLAAEAGAALIARGYHMQVTPHEGQAALFDLVGGRRAIRASGDGFLIGDEPISRAALLERASAHPETFSPNVLLRPVVQDTIFPTVCYVAGPSELAYLGQLKGVYEHFGVPMPLIQPRATATVLDSSGLRFLKRYKVALPSLEAQDEHALNALLRAQLPPAVEQSMQEADLEIVARLEAVIRAVPAIDPTLEGAARNTLGKLQHELRNLSGKIVQAAKRRDDTLRRQFQHVRGQAFPGGEPQERSVGFVNFLNKYGPAFVDRLAAELPIDAGTHWVVTV